jgi:hypothetical protein
VLRVITPEDFDREPSPADVHFWRLRATTPSALFPDPVDTHVLLEHSDDLYDADLSLLTEILADLDRYLTLALAYVREKVEADPAFFGLAAPADGNLGEPEIAMLDSSWHVRFRTGDFPICDPYGLMVDFVGREPTGIEPLDDVDEIE